MSGKAPKPPLKWAGGKRWLVPYLVRLWNPHRSRRFVEPLCGGLAVSLGLVPDRALINDINPHAVNFYHQLQKGFRISLKMRNDQAYFYTRRTRFNQLIRQGKADSEGGCSAFLLPEPILLQRFVPLQQQGRVQCTIRQVQEYCLQERL